MKKILLLLAFLFSINSFSQETKIKEYSYTQFFKLIEEEKDSVFKLNDAIIKINQKTDKKFFIPLEEFNNIGWKKEKFKEFKNIKKNK